MSQWGDVWSPCCSITPVDRPLKVEMATCQIQACEGELSGEGPGSTAATTAGPHTTTTRAPLRAWGVAEAAGVSVAEGVAAEGVVEVTTRATVTTTLAMRITSR